MALVKMSKLTVVGLHSEKDDVLNKLIETRLVELKETADIETATSSFDSQCQEILLRDLNRIGDAISYIEGTVSRFNGAIKKPERIAVPKRGMARPMGEVTYKQLTDFTESKEKYLDKIEVVEKNREEIGYIETQISKLDAEIKKLSIYKDLPHPTTFYKDTASTKVVVATLPAQQIEKAEEIVANSELGGLELVGTFESTALVTLYAHKSIADNLIVELNGLGFIESNLQLDILPSARLNDLNSNLNGYKEKQKQLTKEIVDLAQFMLEFKLLYDVVELDYKKTVAESNFQTTDYTFVLEGFCPDEKKDSVLEALESVSDSLLVYFDEVAKGEEAPVLYKNNSFTRSFEGVTNMYTPPSYSEVDPNPVMGIFYAIIFGMMVGDIGYGLVLAVLGIVATLKIKQQTGIRVLCRMFGICGVFTMAMGAVYGSFFGYQLFDSLLPSAGDFPKTTMMVCVLFGIFHIIAGTAVKMANQIRDKEYVQAFGVSLMWCVFFVGLFLAVLQPAIGFMDYEPFATYVLPKMVSYIGLGLLGVGLLTVMIFAGHGSGVGGHLKSAFGSVYGLINLFGDIMSYIRIFGLLLSGAMMAMVINQLGGMVFASGTVIAYILGAILLVFAHLFNLVMSVLSVYIHDGRLQYVEFFGKFYTGDGKLFVPFGSDMKHTLFVEESVDTEPTERSKNKKIKT